MGVKCVFLDLTSKYSKCVRQQAEHLGKGRQVHYAKIGDYSTAGARIKCVAHRLINGALRRYDEKLRRNKDLFDASDKRFMEQKPGELNAYIRSLGFRNEEVIGRHVRRAYGIFELYAAMAEKALEYIQPNCVFYDLELLESIRAFLYVAKKKSIPIMSMQHGEGNHIQYSTFPVLSDYYIAYGRKNVEVLNGMGVKADRIFLTGSPDTDLLNMSIGDSESVNNIMMAEKSENKRTVLVCLRRDVYEWQNEAIVKTVVDALVDNHQWNIIIKPHPVGKTSNSLVRKCLASSAVANVAIARCCDDVTALIKQSDLVVTFVSSIIVDSVLLSVPVIAHNDDLDGLWPQWQCNTVHYANNMNEVQALIGRYCSSAAMDRDLELEDSRERFIEEYRFKNDAYASRRIAEAVNNVIG